ncbi:hypothetical protein DTW90_34645 [Neorhizobium sp. P12A]|uniref:hypothetical protein n=1 Tax=Neorhizobium sp. P12A TaxID=2268027 RepID=UPI0011EEFDBD|nr:hypothetical protein [Neorhizobium sp. P12A]KAA0686027.1 hypothetical protein DTW90_34645 [Neorhizobium sp. P12A]
MSRWFRHYAGMMRDEKLVRVAVKTKQAVERVVWVWGAILESAAEINDGGRYEFDAGEAAYFLRCDESDMVCIVECLEGIERLHGGVVARWSDRQFDSDSSKERQRRYRERRKAGGDVQERNGDVGETSRDGEVTLQEADTDTDTDTELDSSSLRSEQPRALDPEFLESKLREAAGDKIQPHGGFVVGPIMALIAAGADLELDVLPTVRASAAKLPRPAKSWSYFVGPIQDAFDRRKAAGTWDHAQPRQQAPPGKTPFQQNHQAAIDAFDRKLGISRDDEFTGTTLDLADRDFRSH